jgi:hypothetical protein
MNLIAWFDQAQPGQTTEYAMSELPQPRLMVFRKEPLMRAIAAMGVSPVTLGIWFFIFVSLTLSVWATLTEPPPQAGVRYLSFFDNISWSISMIYLFPFVVSLTLKYYLEIPNLFVFLLDQTSQNQGNQTELDAFYAWLDRRFNSYWVTAGALALTIGLNLIYFHEILDQLGDPDWITGGKILGSLSKHGRGFTAVGLYAAFVQIVLLYWVINLIWRGVVLAWGLHELFNKRNFRVKIQPLHPDRCSGLSKIGDVAMLLNLTLFLLGIYISLKVVDKIVIQGSALGADIGNPLMLGGYLILAPLLFFFPLGAAHQQMNDARQKFLEPISQQRDRLFSELANASSDDKGLTAIQTFSALDTAIIRLHKDIPVWPFDFRSMQAFVGTVVIPIVPIVLPFATKFIFGK